MATYIPFLPRSRRKQELEEETKAAITRAIVSGKLVSGADISAFRAEWVRYWGKGSN
jgi:dTDP-4-amino-4,6-dideoxygalactose transaminase